MEINEYQKKYNKFLLDFSIKSGIDIGEYTSLVIEDIDNRQWISYNSHTGKYATTPFGHLAVQTIFDYLSYVENDVHHDKTMKIYKETYKELYKEAYTENDYVCDEKELIECAKYLKPYILKLQNIILDLNTYRKDARKAEMKAALLDTWKVYRNAIYTSLWRNIIELLTDNEENYQKESYSNFSEEDIQKLIESNRAEGIELEDSAYNVLIKKFFCFCDYITFYDKNNVPITGRGYISRTPSDVFATDLYHLLVSGLAEIPRRCSRCGHVFYPDDKAKNSKYCDECKKVSPSIRNEKRRQSVRYHHKKVYDKITQSKKYDDDFRNAFMNESNYYWDIIQGKTVTPNPLYRERIKTEAQYKKWLEKKLISL